MKLVLETTAKKKTGSMFDFASEPGTLAFKIYRATARARMLRLRRRNRELEKLIQLHGLRAPWVPLQFSEFVSEDGREDHHVC